MRYKVIIYVFTLLNATTAAGKCFQSFANTCDTLVDVTKFAKKSWSSLAIQPNQCDVQSHAVGRDILTQKIFERCTNLEELYIIDRLQKIEKNAFSQLESLAYLNLYNNKIPYITTEIFDNLPNLHKLELENNQVETISLHAFICPKLKTLNLSNNKLKTAQKKVFAIQGLKKLLLSQNMISSIEKNAFPESLEVLQLESNLIKRLESGTLENLSRLKDLSLSKNELKIIPNNMFKNLNNLNKIDLSYNMIETIEENSFHDVRNSVKLLQLAHNQLKVLKPDIFPDNNAMVLQSLRLDHNKLTFVQSIVFDRIPALRRISIGGNPWQCACLADIRTEMANRGVNYTPCDYQHYFTGNNPNCIQFKNERCVENDNEVGEMFSRQYFNALQGFNYDCP